MNEKNQISLFEILISQFKLIRKQSYCCSFEYELNILSAFDFQTKFYLSLLTPIFQEKTSAYLEPEP